MKVLFYNYTVSSLVLSFFLAIYRYIVDTDMIDL